MPAIWFYYSKYRHIQFLNFSSDVKTFSMQIDVCSFKALSHRLNVVSTSSPWSHSTRRSAAAFYVTESHRATQWTPCEALNCRPHSFESFCWQRIRPNDTPKERQHRCGTDNMPPGQRVGANFYFIFLPCRTDGFHQVVSYVQSVAVSAGKPGLGK